MNYHSFLDDSKDKGAQKVMVSAGFYARKNDWKAFRTVWKRLLKKHKLEYFKSSECHSLTKQFAQFRKGPYAMPEEMEEARKIRARFQSILARHPAIRGIGVAVQLEDYRRIASRPEAEGILPVDPYQAALSSVLFETVKHMRKLSPTASVEFVHDEEDDFEHLRNCYQAFCEMNHETSGFMRGFKSLDDKKTPALQAADLIANHTTFLLTAKLNSRDAVVEMRENISRLGYWDEQYIEAVLRNGQRKRGLPIPLDLDESAREKP